MLPAVRPTAFAHRAARDNRQAPGIGDRRAGTARNGADDRQVDRVGETKTGGDEIPQIAHRVVRVIERHGTRTARQRRDVDDRERRTCDGTRRVEFNRQVVGSNVPTVVIAPAVVVGAPPPGSVTAPIRALLTVTPSRDARSPPVPNVTVPPPVNGANSNVPPVIGPAMLAASVCRLTRPVGLAPILPVAAIAILPGAVR